MLSVLAAVFLQGVFGYVFYRSMKSSQILQVISALLGVSTKALAVFCALIGMGAGVYSLSFLLRVLSCKMALGGCGDAEPCTTLPSSGQIGVLAATAAAVITICSRSSPLYPLNDWVDSNCFLTVGKSMLYGLIPYRDRYEQKGPLLYMLHAVAALISERSFTGVYLLEIGAAFAFLFFGFRTIKLYRPSASVFMMPLVAAVVYSASNFGLGDSAEEFCLPLLAFALFLALRSARGGQLPSGKEYVAVGITSSFVLWIKFSMLGFYLGWFLVILWRLLRQKKLRMLWYAALEIAGGVLIPTVPILLYFGAHHALADLWEVYFYIICSAIP